MLSIILPAYNEEDNISLAIKKISAVLEPENIDFELIFVNDGSKDNTWQNILSAHEKDERVHGVSFSRNFGKESAMFAGLDAANGDCVAVMDCDMQHPPETLVQMYRLWEQGYEVIEGVKSERGKESVFHKFFANSFYWIQTKLSGFDMKASSDFKLMDRKVIDVLKTLPERNTFFRALSFWAGFKKIEIEYEVKERENGASKWSKRALCRYAVNNITSFSSAPLMISFWIGWIAILAGMAYGVVMIVNACNHVMLTGIDTIILLLLLISGLIFIFIGILGYYLGKMYDEVKGRPKYIVSSKI